MFEPGSAFWGRVFAYLISLDGDDRIISSYYDLFLSIFSSCGE